jgi:hypothetical protein
MNGYQIEGNRTYALNDEGERTLVANFTAEIIKETLLMDGQETKTTLTISGRLPDPEEKDKIIALPELDVDADQFPTMSWVMRHWGSRTVIQPGSSNKDNLRAIIQMTSKPKRLEIHSHLGWTRIKKDLVFLHAKGGIRKTGNDTGIQVALPPELAKFDLTTEVPTGQAIKATLGLLKIAPPEVSWPLFAATFLPLFGPVDFAIHVTGRTGTFKSELMSLWQSHYGKELDARHLPGSWSSTGNALEAQAFIAKNVPFTVDDFVPNGTTWQQRSYQQTADKLIRAQGNQAGRARLTDTSNLQATMYPRGIIMSTGEDTPEGHSVRARMLIIELSPGDVKIPELTQAQKLRHVLVGTTFGLIKAIAGEPKDIRKHAQFVRDTNLALGHSRTPSMIGALVAGGSEVLKWFAASKHITKEEEVKLEKQMVDAILKAGDQQMQYLEAADPVDLFTAAIRQILGANTGHIRTMTGGVPAQAMLLGWTNEAANQEVPFFKSHGPTIGWIDWQADEICIDMAAGFAQIKKAAGADLTLTRHTLLKRLKDAGALTRTDDARQRNTIRISAENHARTVICMPIISTLKLEESPNDAK